MDHNYYKERISAYADNSLPPYEQMAVQEHVESCAECREALEKILKLSAWVEHEANLGGDDYFEKQAQKIEARLGLAQTEITPIRKKSWQGLGWKLTSVAATIALVGIVVFMSKDTVLQKSETPKEASPMVVDSQKPELTTGSRLAIPIDSTRRDSGVLKKSDDAKEDDNYKSSPQMVAPSTAPTEPLKDQVEVDRILPAESAPTMREEVQLQSVAGAAVESTTAAVKAKRDVISKPEVSSQLSKTAEQIKSLPVRKVDSLLKSVPGVKTDSSGEVFIRGGRAGEVEYIVNGVPIADPAQRTPIKIETGVLAYWSTIRDSLEEEKKAGGVANKLLTDVSRIATNKPAPMALAERPPEPRVTLAEAYFRIAKISRDTTEISRSIDSLRSIAADTKSPDRTQAKAYLDSLGMK